MRGGIDVLVIGLPIDKRPRRNAEYAEALKRNLALHCIRRIVVIEEEGSRKELQDERRMMLEDPKVAIAPLGRRATFSDHLALMNKHGSFGSVVAMCNADVHFDWSCAKLRPRHFNNSALALTRTDHIPWGMAASDAWAFLSPIPELDAPFELGRHHCDFAFVSILRRSGFAVFNPCFDLVIKHVHSSGLVSSPNTREKYVTEYGVAFPGVVRLEECS